MLMANEVTPFAASLSVGNELLFARFFASLRLALVCHEETMTAFQAGVNSLLIPYILRGNLFLAFY